MQVVARAAYSLFAFVLMACAAAPLAWAQESEARMDAAVTPEARDEGAALISQLGSRDAAARQRAAEELARRADTEQLKLVEGYRLQEKTARVKVALDWALYRMGKDASLFALVRALDSAEGEQAAGYLKQLDSPQPLYIFLGHTKRAAQAHLLEVLAEIGDTETLERIKPLLESFEPTVAVAAENATDRINQRLAQKPAETRPTRPRQVGSSPQDSPNTP